MSITWPVSVMSFPALPAVAAGFGCWAASGSAQMARNAADARVRFSIVHLRDSCKDITSETSDTERLYLGAMNETFRGLIDTFGKGWERGDVETICSVFTEDAVFLETPFSNPDRGMAAIRAYWKDIPLYQAETNFSSGEIYAAGPGFATEFSGTFRRGRTGEQVDARGAIFCETKDGKISEMRMYWHRYAGGREEPKAEERQRLGNRWTAAQSPGSPGQTRSRRYS